MIEFLQVGSMIIILNEMFSSSSLYMSFLIWFSMRNDAHKLDHVLCFPSHLDIITFKYHYGSRKHGEKEPQLFSHCGSFDHHALQLLNNCRFIFLDLSTDTFKCFGARNIPLDFFENTFPTVYHTPQDI